MAAGGEGDGVEREEAEWQRWFQQRRLPVFALAMVHVVCCSGIAYGWTALYPLLIAEGFFEKSATPVWHPLSAVGTLGVSANALVKLPLGFFLDSVGPRATAILGGSLLTTGSLLLAYSDRESLPLVGTGYFLIGIAGPFVQVPTFQFAELFPRRRGAVTALLIVCFELSTGGFELFNVLHHAGMTLRLLFIGLAAIGGLVAVSALLVWPDKACVGPPKSSMNRRGSPLEQLPLHRQLCSCEFGLAACFIITHVLRQGFVLISFNRRAEVVFGGELGLQLVEMFSISLPLGFLPMVIVTACGLPDLLAKRPRTAFSLVSLLSMIWGVLLVIWQVPAYVVAFVLYPLTRQLVFSTFFSFCGATFGFRTFGRITGLASTTAGLVQLLLQRWLLVRVQQGWTGFSEAERWTQVDLLLALLPLPLVLLPFCRRCSEAGRRKVAEERIAAAAGSQRGVSLEPLTDA